jgi:hypothetical protein
MPVAREIIVGMFRGGKASEIITKCEYDETSMSCYAPTNMFKRLVTMLSHGARFPFE